MATDPLPSIEDRFVCDPDCTRCGGTGTVCEDHEDREWETCGCGAAGMPCRPENRW